MNSRRTSVLAALLAAVLLATVAAACGGDDHDAAPHDMHAGGIDSTGPAGSIAVQLQNWSVKPATASAPAGDITFHAVHVMERHSHNEGGDIHELAVARLRADGSQEQVGKTGDLHMGQSANLTLALTPGDYELQCNVVEELGKKTVSHYKEGMHAAFKVQ